MEPVGLRQGSRGKREKSEIQRRPIAQSPPDIARNLGPLLKEKWGTVECFKRNYTSTVGFVS